MVLGFRLYQGCATFCLCFGSKTNVGMGEMQTSQLMGLRVAQLMESSLRCIKTLVLLFICLAVSNWAIANELQKHFLGDSIRCKTPTPEHVLIVADLTVTGEIDDSISLYIFDKLENAGCIRVIGVVSIFGNGKSSTPQIHANLIKGLPVLSDRNWQFLSALQPHRIGLVCPFVGAGSQTSTLATIASLVTTCFGRRPNAVVAIVPASISCIGAGRCISDLLPHSLLHVIPIGGGGQCQENSGYRYQSQHFANNSCLDTLVFI